MVRITRVFNAVALVNVEIAEVYSATPGIDKTASPIGTLVSIATSTRSCRFCLVEWPDRAPDLAANADLNVEIHYEGDSRRVFIHGLSERGSFVIQEIN